MGTRTQRNSGGNPPGTVGYIFALLSNINGTVALLGALCTMIASIAGVAVFQSGAPKSAATEQSTFPTIPVTVNFNSGPVISASGTGASVSGVQVAQSQGNGSARIEAVVPKLVQPAAAMNAPKAVEAVVPVPGGETVPRRNQDLEMHDVPTG